MSLSIARGYPHQATLIGIVVIFGLSEMSKQVENLRIAACTVEAHWSVIGLAAAYLNCGIAYLGVLF